jgi:putative phosphoribosyl transferase
MFMRFKDRADAGHQLGQMLVYLRKQNVVILALPRGGIPVAFEIAHALQVPLDVLNVRKLGVPWHEELAMGAIATGGVRVLNTHVIMSMGVTKETLEEVTAFQRLELDRREQLYRAGRPAPDLHGRIVVLVDDGIATGATVRAAISVIRAQKPAKLILAVPVAQQSVVAELEREVDELVCACRPADLYAISVWYDHFPQLSDAEVQTTLALAAAQPAAALLNVPARVDHLDDETDTMDVPALR